MPGEVFGFLGPNGAGKTTTIRLLMDFIRPSRGTAEIFGLDVRRFAIDCWGTAGDPFEGRGILSRISELSFEIRNATETGADG